MNNDGNWIENAGGLFVPPSVETPQSREFAAFQKSVMQHFPDIYKSVKAELMGANSLDKSFAVREPQGQHLDAGGLVSMLEGVKEPQAFGGMSPEIMRQVVEKTPPVASIVHTRCNQVAAFCQVPESDTDSGFEIAMRDPDRKPTSQEKYEMRQLEDMFVEGGFSIVQDEFPIRPLDELVRMIVRDSLSMDMCAYEIVPGANTKKYPFVAMDVIDAGQIRLTEPDMYHPKRNGIANIIAVQLQQGQVKAEWQRSEIAIGIRNPTSDVRRFGYGISEIEICANIISCILFGIDYNKTYFTSSSVPPGILSITGSISEVALNNLRSQWTAQAKGVGNWWNTPVVATKDGQGVNYVKFRDSNRDMEFHQLIALMINLLCSTFTMHPEEIFMQSWSPSQGGIGGEASPVSRLKNSKDSGLVPMLKMIARMLNKGLWAMFPDRKYILRFKNIDERDEERELKLRTMRLQAGLTLPKQEIADMDGEQHDYADVPQSPYSFQAYSAKQQQDMQEQQGGDPNMQGDPNQMGQDDQYGGQEDQQEQYLHPDDLRDEYAQNAKENQPEQPWAGHMGKSLTRRRVKRHVVEVWVD